MVTAARGIGKQGHLQEVRWLLVSPAGGTLTATLRGIQEALPVLCGAPGQGWPSGDPQVRQALPSAGPPAGMAALHLHAPSPYLACAGGRGHAAHQAPHLCTSAYTPLFIKPSPPSSAAVSPVQTAAWGLAAWGGDPEPHEAGRGALPPRGPLWRGGSSPLTSRDPVSGMMLPQDHLLHQLSSRGPAHWPCSEREPSSPSNRQPVLWPCGVVDVQQSTVPALPGPEGSAQTRGRPPASQQAAMQTVADSSDSVPPPGLPLVRAASSDLFPSDLFPASEWGQGSLGPEAGRGGVCLHS